MSSIAKAAASAASKRSSSRSLALSVHFQKPEFGMKKHEILSRATAFLLAVDPPTPPPSDVSTATTINPYDHIERNERERKARRHADQYRYEPAGGPPRHAKDLGWLEFCPKVYRPVVHCVAASHVLAPWLWKQYYPQDWLKQVTLEDCVYSLEVFDMNEKRKDGEGGGEALAKFGLNPYPIHHPSGMDLAILHLKQEESALKHMKDLGVEVLNLRDDDDLFEFGDEVTFEGFELAEESLAANDPAQSNLTKENDEEDTRVFFPYTTKGKLILASAERILASTTTPEKPQPLPEGLCGGPTIDDGGKVCGVVEGIIPLTHEDKRMAGAASFIPSPRIREFLDWAERLMLEKILPEKLFGRVVGIKAGKAINDRGGDDNTIEITSSHPSTVGQDPQQKQQPQPQGKGVVDMNTVDISKDSPEMHRLFDDIVDSMKKHHTEEEVEAVLGTMDRERQEVMDILTREGGDVDQVIKRVRKRTREEQARILSELMEKQQEKKTGVEDGDVAHGESGNVKQ